MTSLRERVEQGIRSLADAGWFEIRTLFVLFVIVGSVFVFLEIADAVAEGDSRDFDHTVIEMLRHPGDPDAPVGPRWLPDVVRDITALGGTAVLVLLVVLVAVYLALAGRPGLVGLLLAATVGATVLSSVMKHWFDRERPDAAYRLADVSSMSFPSGHSTLAAATYLTLGLMLSAATPGVRLKIFFLAAGILLTVLVGLSRIYLGVHFPTDVAAGWCVGAGWVFGCALLAMRMQRRRVGSMIRE